MGPTSVPSEEDPRKVVTPLQAQGLETVLHEFGIFKSGHMSLTGSATVLMSGSKNSFLTLLFPLPLSTQNLFRPTSSPSVPPGAILKPSQNQISNS